MPLEQLRLKPYGWLQCALKWHGKYDKHINIFFFFTHLGFVLAEINFDWKFSRKTILCNAENAIRLSWENSVQDEVLQTEFAVLCYAKYTKLDTLTTFSGITSRKATAQHNKWIWIRQQGECL